VLGPLSGRLVNRTTDEPQIAIGRVIEKGTVKQSPQPNQSLTKEQRVELINARGAIRRNTKQKPPPH